MSLTHELKEQISKYANLHSWFGFKDWVMGNPAFDPDLKATILSYGMQLMMNRYHRTLP